MPYYQNIYYADTTTPMSAAAISAAEATSTANAIEIAIASALPAGMVVTTAGSVAPTGWLLCDGALYPTGTYQNLFNNIGYTYGGSGTAFNVPDLRGRTIFGSKTPTGPTTLIITIASPAVVTTPTAHNLSTGQMVYFTTTGALPTGITATTGRYWVIATGTQTFNIASSLANAIAGTAINTSGTQSGTHSLYIYDFELGKTNGEVNHAQKTTELATHTHIQNSHSHAPPVAVVYGGNAGQYRSLFATNSPFWSGGDWNNAVTGTTATNQNTGNGLPMNNLPPYQTLNYIIKT